jgi:hypothetical protein
MMANKNNRSLTRIEYSTELRQFAVSLYYYSPKAYAYVRSIFGNALPCERTIREWYSNVNCEPGFIQQSFEFLKGRAEGDKNFVTLITGMAI